jgi:predicted nucleic acid-binding protein
MILIDSNVWCYYFDESCREHEAVVKSVEKTLAKEDILINTVIIIELAHFLIKNLGPVTGKKKLQKFLEFPMTIQDLDYEQVREAIELFCEYSHLGIGGRDATLLSAMKKTGTKKILTHDVAFKRVDWLEVIDPVK